MPEPAAAASAARPIEDTAITSADGAARARGWQRQALPPQAGECYSEFLPVADGLTLAYSHYAPRRDLVQRSEQSHAGRVLILTLGLQGHSFTLDGAGRRFDFASGHSTISAFARVQGQRHFPAGQTTRQLRLLVQERALHQYGLQAALADMAQAEQARLLFFGRSDGAAQHLAQRLLHLRAQSRASLGVNSAMPAPSPLQWHIASLSLLAELLRHLPGGAAARADATANAAAPARRLRGSEQDRLLRARELLMQQYAQPLSIGYLCTAVGLSECQLKRGFRALFGTSAYRMLTAIRMEKARELLEQGLYVSTVAYRVGYQHPSSFSAAFERYYGMPPKAVARTLGSNSAAPLR
ncbi:AraC family transcriptional regulator [Vandammella animalimorsus]|uniref:AraC family transcriptional regulator n=1 Tax=Vandammella animalimorsus TaxID=2029117 RepID=A0A2A2ATH2_9BURK|nr:AraC family transcriptional regulator [Vandammella animalimorsus]PAT40982.1 AraC family transcriptional regulator [Vandammella animalimorsus]